MSRYVAFLRGVSPMNARMPELKRCFEAAGFSDVRTVLSSGNVVFDARASSAAALERRAERAMQAELARSFRTIVRPAAYLLELVASDPFAELGLPPSAKRVVTFLRHPVASPAPALPVGRGGASAMKLVGAEILTAYLPGEKTPTFMALIERAFGRDVTTRTLDTVRKCASA